MSARDRLASILLQQQLRAFVTFSLGDPAVCFAEARDEGLRFLIQRGKYEPWGLLFDRQNVYAAGGGPVWYARPVQYQWLKQLEPRLRSWAVRLDSQSDWVHEREWRIVLQPSGVPTFVSLSTLRPIGLLVGDDSWTGAPSPYLASVLGQPAIGVPPLARGLPRWWWNPATAQFQWLPPLF